MAGEKTTFSFFENNLSKIGLFSKESHPPFSLIGTMCVCVCMCVWERECVCVCVCVCVSALQLIVLMAKGSFNTCKTEEEIEAAKIYIGQRCCKFFPNLLFNPDFVTASPFYSHYFGTLNDFYFILELIRSNINLPRYSLVSRHTWHLKVVVKAHLLLGNPEV